MYISPMFAYLAAGDLEVIDISKTVNSKLTIESMPIIEELLPINSTSEVYIKKENELTYTKITGETGFEHRVLVSNL